MYWGKLYCYSVSQLKDISQIITNYWADKEIIITIAPIVICNYWSGLQNHCLDYYDCVWLHFFLWARMCGDWVWKALKYFIFHIYARYFTIAENLGHAKAALKAAVKVEEELKTTPPSDETVSEPVNKTPHKGGASGSLGSIFMRYWSRAAQQQVPLSRSSQ